jgi:hypothetical protein
LEVDRQKQVEAEKAPPPARRINLILAITFAVLLIVWALVLFGWTTVWYVLGALGAWLATNVLQFLFESEKLRKIDQFLGVVLGSPRTTYMLGGLLIFGIVGSLFVGSVQAPPEDDKFDVRIARLAEDHIGKRLDPGHVRAFPTMLGWPREVMVWADGYQPRPVKIWPWWRQRLRVADGDFHLTPYVLIAADNQLAPSIHNKHPWELEIRVNDKTSKLINFYGEFVLLGDTDRQPDWIKKRLDSSDPRLTESRRKTQTIGGGEPTLVAPPILLTPGDIVKVRLRKWLDESGGKFRYEPQPDWATLQAPDPGNRHEAMSLLILPEPKPN